ncbi:hypothetical protein [Crinalium epipsammum]|uniref:hypothetical protein n=1 Tax=Crinalium epipsammum TaxID=241425 RepID=UPI00059CDD3B|nr:hypothetical protein [Crinalium epipsammum]
MYVYLQRHPTQSYLQPYYFNQCCSFNTNCLCWLARWSYSEHFKSSFFGYSDQKATAQGSPLPPSAVEQIQDVSQIRGSQTICDGSSLQGVPASKTRQGNEVLTNSTIERNTQLIRSIRFLSQ